MMMMKFSNYMVAITLIGFETLSGLFHPRYKIPSGLSLIITLLLLFAITQSSIAQQPELNLKDREAIISKIENIAERSEQELDYSDLLDDLYYFLENPLSLNTATFDDMKQLIFLSDYQINKIIEYRNMYGDFMSIFELQAVDGMDEESVRILLPFVTAEKGKVALEFNTRNIFKYGKHDLFIRYSRILEEQEGYREISDSAKEASPNSYYLGSADKIYARYAFNYRNKFRIGITADKDPGEEFFKGTQPNGFDFYSAFLYASDLGIVKSVVVGDYHVEFGQGLTLWTGLSFGKSPDAMSIQKNAREIRPNTSVNENLFLRGVATTVKVKDFELTGFYSSKKIDGNLGDVDTLTQEVLFVTSIQQSGYHRTNAEIEDKNTISEKLYGSHLEYRRDHFKVGGTVYKTNLNPPVKTSGQLYQKFNFSGSDNLNWGIDGNVRLGPFNFFGEFSGSENGGTAYIAGMQASLNPRLALSVFYRNYGIKYQNLYSNAIGEGSRNQNEKGLYAGVLLRLHKNWSFNGYVDRFDFPWIRYRVDGPSRGSEYLGQLNFFPTSRVELYFRYRYEQKKINSDSEDPAPKLDKTRKESFRFHISYVVTPSIMLKNRVEFLRYKEGENPFGNGFLIYQDVMIRPPEKPYDITFRYAIFDTDGYDERIYAYENDVLYAFSIPAYNYKGSRFYLLLKYEIAGWLDLWLRYAQTVYSDQQVIGTGLNEIDGNTRSEIKAQLRFKF